MEKQSTSSYSCVRTDNKKKRRAYYCLTMTRSSVPKHKHSYSYTVLMSNCFFLPSMMLVKLWRSAALNGRMAVQALLQHSSVLGRETCLSLYKMSRQKSKVIFSDRTFWGCSGRKSCRHRHLCVFFCVLVLPVYMLLCQVYSPKSGKTIGLIISCQNKAEPQEECQRTTVLHMYHLLWILNRFLCRPSPLSYCTSLPPSIPPAFTPHLLFCHLLPSSAPHSILSLCFSVSQD